MSNSRAEAFASYVEQTLPIFAETPFHTHLQKALKWLQLDAPVRFSFNDLVSACGLSGNDEVMSVGLCVANAITGTRNSLVNAHLEYLADDGSRHHIIPKHDRETRAEYIIDPTTGRRVDDYQARTYLMFEQCHIGAAPGAAA